MLSGAREVLPVGCRSVWVQGKMLGATKEAGARARGEGARLPGARSHSSAPTALRRRPRGQNGPSVICEMLERAARAAQWVPAAPAPLITPRGAARRAHAAAPPPTRAMGAAKLLPAGRKQLLAAGRACGPQRRAPRAAAALSVAITGGTKGIGRALAEEFVRAGDSVAICSRDAGRVAAAVAELTALAAQVGAGGRVVGRAADVAAPADVAAFADAAAAGLGGLDLWINNAGSNGYAFAPLSEQDPAALADVVATNVLGTLLGCREAIRVGAAQPAGRTLHVFCMDGAGADGGATPRFAAYGATKRGVEQLGKSLRAELRMQKVANVQVHALSPGMVTTELLMAGADNKLSRWFINALAEEPATVAAALVPRIRAVPVAEAALGPLAPLLGGAYVRFLTKPAAYGKIFRKLFGQGRNRFVPED